MKSTLQCFLGMCLLLGPAYAQGWQTNDASPAKAVQIASRLWRGMSEEEVVNRVEKESGLWLGLTAEVPRAGGSYLRLYSLRDGYTLQLEMNRRANSYLTAASLISSSNGVKSISITLTKAPQRSGAANRGQPIGSGTNRTSGAAGPGD